MRPRSLLILITAITLLGATRQASAQIGACCTDATGTCQEAVPMANCQGVGQRFIDGGVCGDFMPACGLGACCFDDESCMLTTMAACPTQGIAYAWTGGVDCPDIDCTDCNNNQVPDSIDISGGGSEDCNANMVPDECDIADLTSLDCNANGIPDECDISDLTSTDCDVDGVPDECQIEMDSSAPSGPFFCSSGCDPDCNNNGIPDICEVPSSAGCPTGTCTVGCSLDADENCVPDECIFWTDASPSDSNWHNPGNWSPSVVPDNSGPSRFSAIIDNTTSPAIAFEVILDADATVDSLKMITTPLPMSEVNPVLVMSSGSLTMDDDVDTPGIGNGIHNQGLIIIRNDNSLIADAAIRIAGPGSIRLESTFASLESTAPGNTITNLQTIEGFGEINSDFINELAAVVDANNSQGTLQILDNTLSKENNGLFRATQGSVLTIKTNVTEAVGGFGSIAAIGGTVSVQSDPPQDDIIVDGCGPIDVIPGSPSFLDVDAANLVNFNSWTIGNSAPAPGNQSTVTMRNQSSAQINGPIHVTVNGIMNVSDSSVLCTDLFLDSGSVINVSGISDVTVAGSFSIQGTDELLFQWDPGTVLRLGDGSLLCGPSMATTTIEAGGQDLGPLFGGGGYNQNFDLGVIELVDNSAAMLVDNVDNGNGLTTPEVLYADFLNLGVNATLFLNGITLYVGGFQVTPGPFGAGQVVDLEACCLPDGTCVLELVSCCDSIGGNAQGAGSVCGIPEACCLPNGACILADPSCCASQGGSPQGGGSTCAPNEACCLPGGACIDTDPACCVSAGGNPLGLGTVCSVPEACCLPSGCIDADPLCCADLGGTSLGTGQTCAPPAACCFPDDSCVDTDPACCAALGGFDLGPTVTCLDSPCVAPNVIPAGSRSAMLALLLLILTTASIAIWRCNGSTTS